MTAANLSVSPEVKALLPDALINYIWQLTLSDECQASENQTFTLEPKELGGRGVQDILHSCKRENFQQLRRVFGVEPVRCNLKVIKTQGSYEMLLY